MKGSKFAETQPHAAYTAFTFGLRKRWTYAMRTLSYISDLLIPLESAGNTYFIPDLFGIRKSDRLRRLVALPARMGGMGIVDPTSVANDEHSNSLGITDSIVNSIIQQKSVRTGNESSALTVEHENNLYPQEGETNRITKRNQRRIYQ